MKQPLSYFSILLLCVLFSCRKEHEPESIDETSKEDLYTNDSIKVEDLTPYDNPPEKAGEYSYLGYGYDVTGRFADGASVKKQVIDIEKLLAAEPAHIVKDLSTIADTKLLTTGDAVELARLLSSGVKDYRLDNNADQEHKKYFKGEFTTFFSRDSALSAWFIYGYYSTKVTVRNFKMYTDFSKYTLPFFQQDVQKLAATEIIEKYGTHILTNISLGGRLTAFYQAKTGNQDREKAARMGLTVTMWKIFGIATGAVDYLGLQTVKGNFSQKLTLDVTGGDISKVKKSVNAETGVMQVEVTDWQHSLTRDNGGMIDIREVHPIYEAIADPVKKEEVKKYLETYLLENEVKVSDK